MEDNMVFFMNRFYRSAALLLTALMLSVFVFTGCSSSDDDSQSLPLSAPNNMALTAKSGTLTVQFSRVAGVGAEGSETAPSYEVYIGTSEDGSDMELMGEIPPVNSNLVRFHIVRTLGGTDAGPEYLYPLVDGNEYWIFVNAKFEGYGTSPYAKLQAVPIPMPTVVTNPTIAVGDKRIVVSWTAKPYEEYSVNFHDCPNNTGQITNTLNNPNFWGSGNLTSGNNYVFTLDDNVATYRICMTSTNINGKAAWHFFGTVDPVTPSITYDPIHGEAATAPPVAPVVEIVGSANKRVDITFPVVLTGNNSASDYQYAYQEQGTGTWSGWESILISSLTEDVASASVTNLENGKAYNIKVRAVNTVDTAEGAAVSGGAPVYIAPNLNNPDEFLSKANAEYIYAEDVPHSDFWRISASFKSGGRPGTDRLVRGKETALGNLYADAVQWYAVEHNLNPDFSWLIGDMINNGIQRNQTITPRFLNGITNQDFIDDTIVIVTLQGSDLISSFDYALDLDDYPAVGTNNGYTSTLFGQAAAVYRNGHYGGSGGTIYNGVYWGMPSKEVKYTIQYKAYDIAAFNAIYARSGGKQVCIDARNANDGAYDSVNDPEECYLLPYAEANPTSGSPTEGSVMGYKRGKIKTGSLTVGGAAIVPGATYKIATTKRIADSHYVAFLNGTVQDTGVTLLRAVSEYIFDQGYAGMTPMLDGRVKIEGGVPGNTNSDYKEP
jgi:hypothetical protein